MSSSNLTDDTPFQACGNKSQIYPTQYVIPSGLWMNLTTGEEPDEDLTVNLNSSGIFLAFLQ